MEERFRAYSFVDRITSVQPGERIRGSYTIPAGLSSFPMPLLAEATGQLAAWAAKASVDFAYQPVAGIAGGIDLLAEVTPGQTVELEAELEKVDAESINYSGTALVDGTPVLRLRDCLGPMISMDTFDDPARVRERYELLCGAGAEPGAFGGIPEIPFTRTGLEPGESASEAFTVPESAAFFGDHFPRRAVFPATLMLEMNMKMGSAFLTETRPPAEGQRWRTTSMSRMKMRSFIRPGTDLEASVKIKELGDTEAQVLVEARKGKRMVSSGRAQLILEEVKS